MLCQYMAEDTVPTNPSPPSKFPANREINREFCGFGHSAANFASNQRGDSAAYGQIPYATEQGIFGGLTGNFFQRTGNFRARTENSTSDQFFDPTLVCAAHHGSRAAGDPGRCNRRECTSQGGARRPGKIASGEDPSR